MKNVLIPLVLLLASPLLAQESDSYRLTDYSFGAGGELILESPSFTVTLASIGAGAVETAQSSASYRLDTSFVASYPPPGEVVGLRFVDGETLAWDPEPSVGDYGLYRDLLSNLMALGYGNCEEHSIVETTTIDSDEPPSGDGYFYLVTAENMLDEEGTKGYHSDWDERPNDSPCP